MASIDAAEQKRKGRQLQKSEDRISDNDKARQQNSELDDNSLRRAKH